MSVTPDDEELAAALRPMWAGTEDYVPWGNAEPDRRAAALAAIPAKYATPDQATVSKLPKPVSKDAPKGLCEECGGRHGLPAVHIDYQGHADVTLALLDVDPFWQWEPAAVNPATGGPVIVQEGGRLVMWGWLEVLGVRRRAVGTCETNKPDPEKELIGDLLRNGAMRFGFATRLWSKADRADPAGSDSAGGYERRQQSVQRAQSGQGGRVQRPAAAERPAQPERVQEGPRQFSPEVRSAWERVRAAGSVVARAQALAALASVRGRKLTLIDFAEHPDWHAEVVTLLDAWEDEDRAGRVEEVADALSFGDPT